ncbi:hypothetical protein KIW84_064564 [Lathyrus oleraceus]|uniref:DUF7745 domain-containing protein n=1 Tax=Pisum sativum TaxID=3888 RepID=A0A9D5A6B5_PEA|nr:hypothetical protein KIW84_064564 [Pisum sativum]
MSLSHSDIRWCSRSMENVTIIDRCGEFPNVPLLGIRGGITYNPSLALRQFGYARTDGPHDMLIQGIVFDYDNDLQGYRQRFIRAWGKVNKTLMMPYPAILPVTMEPVAEGDTSYIILHPDMPTDMEELQRSRIQLKEQRDTFETHYKASQERVLELTKQLHEERNLNSYLNTKRKRPWET